MRQLVAVYRDAEALGPFGEPIDCTNGGISSRFTRLMVYSPDEDIPADPMADANTPIGVLAESVRRYVIIRPHPTLLRGGPKAWTMFGGNFGSSSDGRFLDAVEAIAGFRVRAVPIHDREEP